MSAYKPWEAEFPQGISKNAWKKLQKKRKWEDQKEEWKARRKEKKVAARRRKAESKGIEGHDNNTKSAKKIIPQSQIPSNVEVIMDCEFDNLMSDKEIVSLSNQITRCYSAMRHSTHEVKLRVSSFNKRLRERFENTLPDYTKWKNICFEGNETLDELLPSDSPQRSRVIYLTADTDNELEELKDGDTYIIGGIVDKNRHKNLCLEKANKLGISVARLPIGKFIKMNGRQVLATSHVYEIMCMWFEQSQDWEKAFNVVLPPRKINSGACESVSKEDGNHAEQCTESKQEALPEGET